MIVGFLEDGHSVSDMTFAMADSPVISVNALNIGLDKLAKKRSIVNATSNGAKPNALDAQQVAERQRQGMTPLDRAEEAVRVARMTGDPLSIEAAEIELAQLSPSVRVLTAVAS